jgi:hypothetical protein
MSGNLKRALEANPADDRSHSTRGRPRHSSSSTVQEGPRAKKRDNDLRVLLQPRDALWPRELLFIFARDLLGCEPNSAKEVRGCRAFAPILSMPWDVTKLHVLPSSYSSETDYKRRWLDYLLTETVRTNPMLRSLIVTYFSPGRIRRELPQILNRRRRG